RRPAAAGHAVRLPRLPGRGDARARHARHPLRLRDRGPAARRAPGHAAPRGPGRGLLPPGGGAGEPLQARARHAAHPRAGRPCPRAARLTALVSPERVRLRGSAMKVILAVVGIVLLAVVVWGVMKYRAIQQAATGPAKEIVAESLEKTGDTWHAKVVSKVDAQLDKVVDAFQHPARVAEVGPERMMR